MKKTVFILISSILLFALTFTLTTKDIAQAATYTLKIKSTGNNVNVREKLSTKSKIMGKLKKNQTVAVRTLKTNKDYESFYEVIYKGKKAYVSVDYAQKVKPNQRWIGSYGNNFYGSAAGKGLFVYKKTSKYIYFVSHTGLCSEPIGNLSNAEKPWKYYDYYYGKAKLTSSTSASFSSKGCKITLKSVDNTIRVYDKSKEGSCEDARLAIYDEFGAYEK